jgi:hypothetical protein
LTLQDQLPILINPIWPGYVTVIAAIYLGIFTTSPSPTVHYTNFFLRRINVAMTLMLMDLLAIFKN